MCFNFCRMGWNPYDKAKSYSRGERGDRDRDYGLHIVIIIVGQEVKYNYKK